MTRREAAVSQAVESLPEPVDVDVGFAAYRSRVEVAGSGLKYTRSFELRELQVPAARFEDYRGLQRAIARDERTVVVLKGPGDTAFGKDAGRTSLGVRFNWP